MITKNIAYIASSLLSAAFVYGGDADARFFRALAAVEGKYGSHDSGKARGPYQIHERYWRDACAQSPRLADRFYSDCDDTLYARAVVVAYAQRHAAVAWRKRDWFRIAQVHQAGPRGAGKGRGGEFARRVVALIEDKTWEQR